MSRIRIPVIGDKLFNTVYNTENEHKFIGTISYIIPPSLDDDEDDYDLHIFMWTDLDGQERGPYRMYGDEAIWDETLFGYIVNMF